MWDSKLFKTGIGILLVFLIIYIGSRITFVFQPFIVAFEALFFSFLISGLFYYLTFPFVDWLDKHKLPRTAAILIIYLLAAGLLVFLGITAGPILQDEFTSLAKSIPEKIKKAQPLLFALEDTGFISRLIDPETTNIDNFTEGVAGSISNAFTQVATSAAVLFEFITNIFMTIIIVPFLLYYMLKEKNNAIIPGVISHLAPPNYVTKINTMLAEMNRLLSFYVQGLAIVCLCVGILSYIGFLIIGLDYALILAIFIIMANIVPFLGPFIGAIPAVLVGLLESPLMMLKVIAVIIIVQQMESLLISPQVMGRKLALSPLAIILVVLVAGRLGGIVGIILAIPLFTMFKIIGSHLYEQIQFNRKAPAE